MSGIPIHPKPTKTHTHTHTHAHTCTHTHTHTIMNRTLKGTITNQNIYHLSYYGFAFQQGLLDENFSVELPHVLGSHLALDALRQHFPGTVHDLTSASDLFGLDLSSKGNYLVIVRLAPVAGAKNEEAAIASNGEFQVTSCL